MKFFKKFIKIYMEEKKMTNILQHAFRKCADNAYDENVHEYAEALLDFAMKRQYECNTLPLITEEARYDLQMHLRKTIRNLQENDNEYDFADSLQMANALLREVTYEPKYIVLYTYYWFVKKNFSILKKYRDTYLLLASITAFADGWKDSEELESELASILASETLVL